MSRKLYDNTETLEEVLELLNNKAAGGGGTDTSDATATSADILIDKTAYANGEKITGSIPLQSAKTITPSASEQVAISSGYYASGDVKVQGDANLTAENIKKGATIFGVEGNYEGGGGGGEKEVNKIADYINKTIKELTATDLDGVVNIPTSAFSSSPNLISVEIPNSVVNIGYSAFEYCNNLKTIIIPPTIKSINSSAFNATGTYKKVYITDIEAWCNISFGSSSSCPLLNNSSLYLNDTFVKEIVLSDSVKSIGNYAFYNYSYLRRVDFSSFTSVPSIGSYTFYGNSSVLQFKVPANLIDEWKAATNWANIADKIVTEFTN